MCWYCTWGLPKPIADIYIEAVRKLDGDDDPLHFSASHIVWDDYNFHSAQWCLDNFDLYSGEYNEEEKGVIRWSLEQLLTLPNEIKDDGMCKEPCPNDCSLCPPPPHWKMADKKEIRDLIKEMRWK